eukprot:UN2944
MGYILPEYYRFDGYLSPSYDLKFADVPNGLGAISKVPALGWAQIVLFAGTLELFKFSEGALASRPSTASSATTARATSASATSASSSSTAIRRSARRSSTPSLPMAGLR